MIIATFQGDRFLAAQLESILSQLSPDDEVVISDDASTDRTLDIVKGCGDIRIRLITNTTRVGYVANFERALERVTGEYVYFSDQDDVWLPDKVAALDAALARKACAASDAVVTDESLRTLHPSYFKCRRAKYFSPLAIFLRPRIIGATMACRRVYLESMRPFPPGVPHDFWLTLNAAWDDALCVIPRPLILYRRHGAVTSITATYQRRSTLAIARERIAIASAIFSRRFRRATPERLK